MFWPGRGGVGRPRGRTRVEGVKCSFFSPLGIGMREMAEMALGLRSRPTWRGTWAADGFEVLFFGEAVEARRVECSVGMMAR